MAGAAGLVACLLCTTLAAQEFQLLDSSARGVSYRGMHMAGDGSIWVSGSKGTVLVSTNTGNHWKNVRPAGFETRDFRDVWAFDSLTAVLMAIDSPGIILRTTNGGQSWQVVYEDHRSGIFLDDLHFKDRQIGICAGDPMEDGRLVVLYTLNGGVSWQLFPTAQRPAVQKGEALFAASGSNITDLPAKWRYDFALVTGGTASRLWLLPGPGQVQAPEPYPIPLQQGASTTGANALLFAQNRLWIIGGDFGKAQRRDSVLAYFVPGKKMTLPLDQPAGYKSSIAAGKNMLVSCGTTGVEWLFTTRKKRGHPALQAWANKSTLPMHVVRHMPGTNLFFVAGPNGYIGKIEL